MTYAKFVSDKKGNFWFIVFLNFIATKRVKFTKFVSDKRQFLVCILFAIINIIKRTIEKTSKEIKIEIKAKKFERDKK
mgnify:CR=1 FL=1